VIYTWNRSLEHERTQQIFTGVRPKKSRFLVEESKTWHNTTIIWWRRLKNLQNSSQCDLFAQWIHTERWAANTWTRLKHVNLWHACGGANSSFVSSFQDKNCSWFVSFSFFLHICKRFTKVIWPWHLTKSFSVYKENILIKIKAKKILSVNRDYFRSAIICIIFFCHSSS